MIRAYFRLEKATPGAIRYKEITKEGKDFPITQGAALGTLYIRKTAFKDDGNYPRVIAVVIDEIDLTTEGSN